MASGGGLRATAGSLGVDSWPQRVIWSGEAGRGGEDCATEWNPVVQYGMLTRPTQEGAAVDFAGPEGNSQVRRVILRHGRGAATGSSCPVA
eukprot:4428849-Pyramimonas_sp.AAC.4